MSTFLVSAIYLGPSNIIHGGQVCWRLVQLGHESCSLLNYLYLD